MVSRFAPTRSRAAIVAPVASLPTRYGDFRLQAVRGRKGTHLVLVKGKVRGRTRVPVRLHSQCLTGDTFGSLRCDCGEQLRRSMRMLSRSPRGVLLYLAQEGRGIGLYPKLQAYNLQDRGLDTVEANHALGFRADERTYEDAVHALQELGVRSIVLYTNNPAKLRALKSNGVSVDAIKPLRTRPNPHNSRYLLTKSRKLGHSL